MTAVHTSAEVADNHSNQKDVEYLGKQKTTKTDKILQSPESDTSVDNHKQENENETATSDDSSQMMQVQAEEIAAQQDAVKEKLSSSIGFLSLLYYKSKLKTTKTDKILQSPVSDMSVDNPKEEDGNETAASDDSSQLNQVQPEEITAHQDAVKEKLESILGEYYGHRKVENWIPTPGCLKYL